MKENYRQTYKSTEQNESGREEFVSLPEFVTSPYPFVAIGDLAEMVAKIVPIKKDDVQMDGLQQELLEIQRKYAPLESTFYYIEQTNLLKQTESRIKDEFLQRQTDANKVGLINFDRYILSNTESNNMYRLNLSRGADGKLTKRPGSTIDKQQQIERVSDWLEEGAYDEIMLIDDVVAFATTFPPIIEIIKAKNPNTKLVAVCGICSSGNDWSGIQKLQALGVEVKAVSLCQASPSIPEGTSGMAIPDTRDSTIFGGKVGVSADGRSLSYPYFYPFSWPTPSLVSSDKKGQASKEYLEFNQKIVANLEERLGRALLIKDLENAGFGVPYTSIDDLKTRIAIPDGTMPIKKYLCKMEKL